MENWRKNGNGFSKGKIGFWILAAQAGLGTSHDELFASLAPHSARLCGEILHLCIALTVSQWVRKEQPIGLDGAWFKWAAREFEWA